jgi:hypothetical protein
MEPLVQPYLNDAIRHRENGCPDLVAQRPQERVDAPVAMEEPPDDDHDALWG